MSPCKSDISSAPSIGRLFPNNKCQEQEERRSFSLPFVLFLNWRKYQYFCCNYCLPFPIVGKPVDLSLSKNKHWILNLTLVLLRGQVIGQTTWKTRSSPQVLTWCPPTTWNTSRSPEEDPEGSLSNQRARFPPRHTATKSIGVRSKKSGQIIEFLESF